MRWKGRRQSDNIEDRRGMRGPAIVGGGLGTIVLIIIVMALGGDPSALLKGATQGGQGASVQQPIDPAEAPLREFVGVVLADTEDVWTELFQKERKTYQPPNLVLFSQQVESACGVAGSSVGPFYCGEDQKVYLDLSFFQEMGDRLGAKGDFAQAYVIAHEVGHHIQKQLGILDQVHAERSRLSASQYNQLSVRLELQADFFAGVWAHHAQDMADLDRQDITEAVEAAEAIGDDRLQMQSQGFVVPDAFTHGTSEQRIRWFVKGFESGQIRDGDTFNARRL